MSTYVDLIETGIILLDMMIFVYMWFDAFLYKLFSVEMGSGELDIVFSNLWYEIVPMERTKEVLKTNKIFIIFPLMILISNLSVFNQMYIVDVYLFLTLTAYPLKCPIINLNGHGLIEDFICNRYPHIPNGVVAKEEHKHLFTELNSNKIQSKCSQNLGDSSILFLTFESADFDYIFDENVLSCKSDNDLLTKGIDELEKVLQKHQRFFIHIHSANSHLPYFIENSQARIYNDKQRFQIAIQQTDSIFEQIYLYLNEKVKNNLLTIISSDHGQAFGEENCWTHGNAMIQQEINVPLIFHHPKLNSAKTIDFSTHFDIFPTLLELLGLDYLNQLGCSLLDDDRLNECLVWDGQPSRGSPICYGLIVNHRKYRLDLLRNTLYESDLHDQSNEEKLFLFEILMKNFLKKRNFAYY